ncbi:MAG: hypothetical protein HYV04_15865 [Deltaproteobacteria bacterium]|nr:hypothetical protein [Deltaproteobacteria bacterium]
MPRMCGPVLGLLILSLLGCQAKEQGHIFPGEPTYDVIPKDLPLSDLFKEAPKPTFSTLKFVKVFHEKSRPAERLQFERVTSLTDTQRVFSRIKSISEVPRDPGQYIDYEINAGGLLNAAFLSIKRYKTREIHFKSYIKEVVSSDGRLFPLRVGNRMTVKAKRLYQAPVGAPSSTPAVLNYSYSYDVVEELDGDRRFGAIVPGKVFVINFTERHPEGVDNKQLYYSQQLGAVIVERSELDGVISELRVVSWE